jgi:hypothetical protein
VKLAYADPPYLGCCSYYGHHHEAPYGCWDDPDTHYDLRTQLDTYDGWVLHASSPSLPTLLVDLGSSVRIMAWVKPFAAFKPNIPVAYAWEPVMVKAARKPEVAGRMVMRDWIDEPITMRRGLTGAKPERVCHWAFEMMGAHRDDELVDLFPGSGAVSHAWDSWRSQFDFR